jgi:hypothetical protein
MTAPAQNAQGAFFSYSRGDTDFALRLAGDLKAGGANVWLDQLDINPGVRWDRAVEDALTNCTRIVVILSPGSVSSTNVMDEVSFALEKQKTVIPVIYQDCIVPFRLRRLQHIDFRRDYLHGFHELLKTLAPPGQEDVRVENGRRKAAERAGHTSQQQTIQAITDNSANRQSRFVSASVEWKRKDEPDPTPRRWVVYVDNDSDAPITVERVKVSSPSMEMPIKDWGTVRPKCPSDYELEESDFDPSGDRPEVYVRFLDSFGQRWTLRRGVLKHIGGTR